MQGRRGCRASRYWRIGATLLLVAGLGSAAPLGESATVFELNPAQSHVAFTLTSLLHTVHGTFRVKRGSLQLDPTHSAVNGECVVDATSGNSGNHRRDRKMHTEVLESHRYPDILFSPVRIRGAVAPQGESTVQVDGTFTIHGTSHPLTIAVVVRITRDSFTVSTDFLIPYVQWGMRDPSTFILTVGKQVQIHFEATGRIGR
jgi:polyisoprenoid-binding protein YceI